MASSSTAHGYIVTLVKYQNWWNIYANFLALFLVRAQHNKKIQKSMRSRRRLLIDWQNGLLPGTTGNWKTSIRGTYVPLSPICPGGLIGSIGLQGPEDHKNLKRPKGHPNQSAATPENTAFISLFSQSILLLYSNFILSYNIIIISIISIFKLFF